MTIIARLRARTRAWLSGRIPAYSDTGSIAMALLVAIVGSGIAAVLIPMVIVQIHSTNFDNSRARELSAAQAGTAVALGMVRAAVEGGDGVTKDLPCTTTQPITGSYGDADAGLNYRASVAYYTQNPLGQDADWLATYGTTGDAHGMLCVSGIGTYYWNSDGTAEQVPSYVLITSTGSDSRGGRTLRSTYYVKTTNANVAGGTIAVYTSSSAKFCMDAGSADPSGPTPTAVVLQPCRSPVAQQQAWAYRADLSIQLVSSVTTQHPNGLCLTAGSASDSAESANEPILLQKCAALGDTPWNQMWSSDDNAALEGATNSTPAQWKQQDHGGWNGLCLDVASQASGVPVTLQGCQGGIQNNRQTWVPSPDAGSGMAGAGQEQMVNFQQFGRCMDVTNQRLTGSSWSDLETSQGGNLYMIAYSCKQSPSGVVTWNQTFRMVDIGPAAGGGELVQWQTTQDNTNYYCLASPGKTYSDTQPDGAHDTWVTVTPCPANPAANNATVWTRYDGTDANGDPWPMGTKYTVQDYQGHCLSLSDRSTDAYIGQYSKVVVTPCDPNNPKVQMWNALPDVQPPALRDLTEIGSPAAD